MNKFDPTGEEAWLVSRPTLGDDHMFVVIADKLGGTPSELYSYGPDGLPSLGSALVANDKEHATYKTDMASWVELGNENSDASISAAPIEASNDAVKRAGDLISETLNDANMPRRVGYDPVPVRGFGTQANSNSAAYAQAAFARKIDGRDGPQSLPSGTRAPGWGQADRVLKQVTIKVRSDILGGRTGTTRGNRD